MTITALGTSSIAIAVPAAASANLALNTACGIAAPNVNAQISALASFSPSLSLSFVDMESLANAILDNIHAAILAIPPIPVLSLSDQIALSAVVVAQLNATLSVIAAQVAIQVAVAAMLATGGVTAYAFDGAQNVLGSELATALGASTTHVNALILVTQSPSTWAQMQLFFRTS